MLRSYLAWGWRGAQHEWRVTDSHRQPGQNEPSLGFFVFFCLCVQKKKSAEKSTKSAVFNPGFILLHEWIITMRDGEPAAPSLHPRFSAHLVPLTALFGLLVRGIPPRHQIQSEYAQNNNDKCAPAAAYVRIFWQQVKTRASTTELSACQGFFFFLERGGVERGRRPLLTFNLHESKKKKKKKKSFGPHPQSSSSVPD